MLPLQLKALQQLFSHNFSRSRCPVTTAYNFEGIAINRVLSVKDLGVTFDSRLSFLDHIDVTVNKARKKIGMIKRFSIRITDRLC